MALNFGRLSKIGDNIAKKVIDEILDEGSEILETLIERIKQSELIDDLVEEVTEAVIEQIILALTGEKVDIEFDEAVDDDEPDEVGLLNPRTEELDDEEMGIE